MLRYLSQRGDGKVGEETGRKRPEWVEKTLKPRLSFRVPQKLPWVQKAGTEFDFKVLVLHIDDPLIHPCDRPMG